MMRLIKGLLAMKSAMVIFALISVTFSCAHQDDKAVDRDVEEVTISIVERGFPEQAFLALLTEEYLSQQGFAVNVISVDDVAQSREMLKRENTLAWEYTGAVFSKPANASNKYDLAVEKDAKKSTVSVKITGENSVKDSASLIKLPEHLVQLKSAINTFDDINGIDWPIIIDVRNQYNIAVRADDDRFDKVATFSDLARFIQGSGQGLKVGLERHFYHTRSDGFKGLAAFYDLKLGHVNIDAEMESTDVYPALRDRDIDIALVYDNDPELTIYQFRLLEDDKHYFPDYYLGISMHENLSSNTKLLEAVEKLASSITQERIVYSLQRWRIDGLTLNEVVNDVLFCESYYQEPLSDEAREKSEKEQSDQVNKTAQSERHKDNKVAKSTKKTIKKFPAYCLD